jgi:hypothetical protein
LTAVGRAERVDGMRRLIAPLAAVLVLAAAPSALASHTTSVHVEKVKLGPGGSVIVTVTVGCTAGYSVGGFMTVRQSRGFQPYNVANVFLESDPFAPALTCAEDGPLTLTTEPAFGQAPFRRGKGASTESMITVCSPPEGDEFHCASAREVIEVTIRRK